MRHARPSIPQVQVVAFRIGAEEFGLDVFGVHEILRHQNPTPLPRAPHFVEGVIDVRGALVPVVDLRRRFEVPHATVDAATRIVVVEHDGERLGLVVDSVSEVMRIPETAVAAAPSYVRGIAAEFIRGIVRHEGRLVVLLDVERILSGEERIALQQESATAGADA